MKEQKNNEILVELKKLNKLVALILVKKGMDLNSDEKIVLLDSVGFSQKEIGEFMSITQSAVSQRLKKK